MVQQRLWFIALQGLGLFAILGTNKTIRKAGASRRQTIAETVVKHLKYLYIIFALLILSSCGDSSELVTQDRILHVYVSDSLQGRYKYKLKIVKDSLLKYNYENITDSSKNMTFSYDAKNELLLFAGDKYEILRKDKLHIPQLKNYFFSFYNNSSSAMDITDPIIFDKDYGVLAIGNSMAPNFIYLEDDDEKISSMLNPKL
ncbi:hypothetical protein GWK09_14735 [Muriicola jejuensis]|uniref:Uncharacterized protein n=1 Tax=Muriicola jejuensis TaxID=504488 RepID=A0A6P0UH36_9FLAO|nr:hypothetical protein [Muriicola jejuensis]